MFKTKFRVINNNIPDANWPFEVQRKRGFEDLWSWTVIETFVNEENAIARFNYEITKAKTHKPTIIMKASV